MSLSVDRLQNPGLIQAGTELQLSGTGRLSNPAGGRLLAAGGLTIGNDGALSNAGVIQAGGGLEVDGAGRVANQPGGTFYGGRQTAFQLGGDLSNAGTIYARQGSVSLGAAALDNRGTLRSAGGEVRVSLVGDGRNAGTAYAQGNQFWTVAGVMTNTGLWAAQGDSQLQAGRLEGDGTLAAGLDEAGQLSGVGDLSVRTQGALVHHGRSLAGGRASLQGAALDLSHSQLRAGGEARLTATAGDIDTRGGETAANGALRLQTPGSILNGGLEAGQGGRLSADRLILDAHGLDNRYGHLLQTGTGDLVLDLPGDLDNAHGELAVNAANLRVSAAQLDNTGGTIRQAGTGRFQLTTQGDLANTGGQIVGNGSVRAQAGGLFGNAGGQLGVAGGLDLAARQLDNRGGTLAGGEVAARVSQAVQNQQGTVQASGDLNVRAADLDNTGGWLKSVGAGALALDLSGGLSNGVGGFIGGNGAVRVWAGQAINAGQLYAGQSLQAGSAGDWNNAGGALQAQADLDAQIGGTLSNRSGRIEAGSGAGAAWLTVQAARLDNTGGRLANTGSGLTRVNSEGALVNRGGTLGGAGDLRVSGTALDNSAGGQLVAGRDLSLNLLRLDNPGGAIYAARDAAWANAKARLANDQGGSFEAGGDVQLRLERIDNAGGALDAGHNLRLDLDTFSNDSGRSVAGHDLHLSLAGSLQNGVGATFKANHDLHVELGGDFRNGAGARLEAVNALSLTAAHLTNAAGGEIRSHATNLTVRDTLNNAGRIEGDRLLLRGPRLFNGEANGAASLIGGYLQIQGGALTNGVDWGAGGPTRADGARPEGAYATGLIASSEGMDLYLSERVVNRDATIFTTGDLHIAADAAGTRNRAIVNRSGAIEADGAIDLATDQFSNQRRVLETRTVELSGEGYTLSERPFKRYRYDFSPPAEADVSQIVGAEELAAAKDYCRQHNHKSGRCVESRDDGLPVSFQGVTTDTLVSATVLARASAAGQLLAGGDITIHGAVLNASSTIAAGKDLRINGDRGGAGGGNGRDTVQNIAWSPTVTLVRRTDEQVNVQRLKHSPRTWVDAGYRSYGRTTREDRLSVAQAQALFPDLPAWAGLNATLSAHGEVAITAQRIDNTLVDAEGAPVRHAFGLEANTGRGPVGGSAVSTVGRVGSGPTAVDGLALGAGTAPQTVPGLLGPPAESRLPQSGLYHVVSDPRRPYLVETDPRFTRYGALISSDYLLSHLGIDPNAIHKRLGDGFFEQRAVLDQITQLTGRRYLADNTDALEQYRRLMDNGVAMAQTMDLAVGVALSADQLAALTQDMVWLVDIEVSGQQVLTPVLYLSAAHARQTASGATIAGQNVSLSSEGELVNHGTIEARQTATLKAKTLLNSGLLDSGDRLSVTAAQDLLNGGRIRAGGDVSLVAGEDVRAGVDVATALGGLDLSRLSAPISPLALSTGPGRVQAGRNIGLSAGRDLSLDRAPVTAGQDVGVAAGRDLTSQSSAVGAGQDAQLSAGRDLKLRARAHTLGSGGSDTGEDRSTHSVSTVTAGGAARLGAGRDLVSQGAQVSGQTVDAIAGRDLDLRAVTDQSSTHRMAIHGQTIVRTRQSDQQLRGTRLSGAQGVRVLAGRDATLTASRLSSQQGAVALAAGRDVHLDAAHEVHRQRRDRKKHRGGLLSRRTTRTHDRVTDTDVLGSTLSGDRVGLLAGHDLTSQAARIAGTHDVHLTAGHDLVLGTAEASHTEAHRRTVKSAGVMGSGAGILIGGAQQKQTATLTETTPTGTLVGSTEGAVGLSAGHDAHIRGSDVLSATGTRLVGPTVLIDAAVGQTDTRQTYKQSASGLSVSLGGAAGQAATGLARATRRARQVSDDTHLQALYAAKAAYDASDAVSALSAPSRAGHPGTGASLKLGFGSRQAKSESSSHDQQAYGSHIQSQGDVTILASQGDLGIIGSQVNGQNIGLAAAHDVNLQAQAEQHRSSSHSSQSGFGAGVQAGPSGLYGYANGGRGQGQAHGHGTTYADTQVNARDNLNLVSGHDLALIGAQATGQHIGVTVGHDLAIISPQATDAYHEHHHAVGGGIMAGAGLVSGGVSLSQGHADNSYHSVDQASGFQAGAGGYDILVGNHTGLIGGQLASTASPDKNLLNTGSLSYQDLDNRSHWSADQTGLSLSGNPLPNAWGSAGAALGLTTPQHHDNSSTTHAGIAPGTVIVRDDPNQDLGGLNQNQTHLDGSGIKNGFDPAKIARNQETGQVAAEVGMRAAGDIEQQMGWQPGGPESTVLHGLIGAGASSLGGGNALQGAAGAAAGEAATPWLVDKLGRGILPVVATLAGGAVGSGAGAASAGAGAAYNYLKHEQVEQLKAKLVDCNGNSACEADAKQWAADISVANDNELAGICGAAPGRAICGQALKASMAYDLNGDMHQLTPDDQIRSTHAMLQSVFDTPNGQKYFNDIDSRKDFFNAYANAMYAKGSDVAWPRAAAEVSGDLKATWTLLPDITPGVDSARQWINQTGNVILDYRWDDLKSLYQSPAVLTGKLANTWDLQTLVKEQAQVQSQYDALQGGAKFWTSSGAAVAPWFLHPTSPQAPVLDIKNSYWRIGQGIDLLESIRKDPNRAWGN